jgi:hypothetical protein
LKIYKRKMGQFGGDGRRGRGRGPSAAPGGGRGGAYGSSGHSKKKKYFSKEDYAKKRLARIETDRFRKIKTLKQYEKLLKSEGVTSSERIRIGGGNSNWSADASSQGRGKQGDEEEEDIEDTSSGDDSDSRSEESTDRTLGREGEDGYGAPAARGKNNRSAGKGGGHKDEAAFQKPFAKEMAVAAARRAEKERMAAERQRREEEARLAREARERKSAKYRRLAQQGRGGAPGLGTLSADIVRRLQREKGAGSGNDAS